MFWLLFYLLIQMSSSSLSTIRSSCSSNSTCGCSLTSTILTKILGGEIAPEDTWRWAVSIRSNKHHTCGGSLITSNIILTAAHCFASVKDASKHSITAASTRLSNIRQQRSIAQVFVHRQYNPQTYENDIAAIRLSSPFDMNDSSLAVLCLSKDITRDYTNNTDVVAIGWGVYSKEEIISDALRQVTLKTVPNKQGACLRAIRNPNVQMCAGFLDGGKDTCQGDSGGPLMVFDNNQWHLIGITSYGTGCGLPTYAGVYTRVSAYEDVIDYFVNNDIEKIEKIFITINSASLISTSFYWILLIIYLLK